MKLYKILCEKCKYREAGIAEAPLRCPNCGGAWCLWARVYQVLCETCWRNSEPDRRFCKSCQRAYDLGWRERGDEEAQIAQGVFIP